MKATLQEYADDALRTEYRQPLKTLQEACENVGWEFVDAPTCCGEIVSVHSFIGPYYAERKHCGRFVYDVSGPQFKGRGAVFFINSDRHRAPLDQRRAQRGSEPMITDGEPMPPAPGLKEMVPCPCTQRPDFGRPPRRPDPEEHDMTDPAHVARVTAYDDGSCCLDCGRPPGRNESCADWRLVEVEFDGQPIESQRCPRCAAADDDAWTSWLTLAAGALFGALLLLALVAWVIRL